MVEREIYILFYFSVSDRIKVFDAFCTDSVIASFSIVSEWITVVDSVYHSNHEVVILHLCCPLFYWSFGTAKNGKLLYFKI